MTKKVVYVTCTRLSCISVTPSPSVILCLTDSALLAPVVCPDSVEEVPYAFTTLEALLTKSWKNVDNCGNSSYSYVFSYDETLLADPATALVASQISGVFCEGCLTDWVQERVGNEISLVDNGDGTFTLTSQHGCTYVLSGGGEAQEPLLVADTETVDLTINGTIPQTLSADVKISADPGNTISAHADGIYAAGGAGSACVFDVTTAQLNTLIAGDDLEAGCIYNVTDHSQNRVPADTIVTMTALSTNQLTSSCSVITSYDTKAWRGVYDQSTNLLMELWDNQGNYANNYGDAFNPSYTCVDDFDWGNTNITNCSVTQSTWIIDYGIVCIIEGIKLETTSTLDMTGYTGTYLYNVTISNFSYVDLSSGNMEMEEVQIKNSAGIAGQGDLASGGSSLSFLFNVVVDYGFITTVSGSALYCEGTNVRNLAGIYNVGVGTLNVLFSNIYNQGEVRVSGTIVNTGTTEVFDCTIADGSTVTFLGVSTVNFSVAECTFMSFSTFNITSITVSAGMGIFMFNRLTMATNATLNVTGSATLHNVQIEQATFDPNGFNQTDVYVRGVGAKTATAANTAKGKDYFNDNIT